MKNECIILVFNKNYLEKANDMILNIRNIGKYYDDIVCIVSDDLKNCDNIIYKNSDNVIIKKFDEIDRSNEINILKNNRIGDGREINKTIQWHKLYCFHKYFKENYKKCLYIDVGMHIFKPLEKIFNIECDNNLLAHSDAYPTFKWKLNIQFNSEIFPEQYIELSKKYDLNVDYFQSGIMLFNTSIINDDTFDNLIDLSKKYIISKTNEQGILNIYFNCIHKQWKQLPIKDNDTYYYDYWERFNLSKNDYIMLKYPKK
jgi:hypothetical protein